MTLYIIYNKISDKFYIGVTNNIGRRLKEHNGETNHYTGKNQGEWIVKYSKHYKNSIDAFKEEKRLKKAKNRKYLEWYIQQTGPVAQW